MASAETWTAVLAGGRAVSTYSSRIDDQPHGTLTTITAIGD
jgi:hypothetical protein